MRSGSMTRLGWLALYASTAAFAVAGCSKKAEEPATTETTSETTTETEVATTPPPAPAAPPADNTDTLTGVKLAAYTGDAAKGKTAFITCQTCHSIDAGVNKIGPSLHAVIGRKAGTIAGFAYTPANKNSGITWTPEKLFQYLENPQRIVPGTKMIFPGFADPQKRADVIAYLQANTS